MAQMKRVFVLLIGNKERGDVNHFQLLQEETANEGRRLEIDVEVAFAPGFDQLRTLKRRIIEMAARPLDAVVTEPANTATLDMILNELKGKLGLVILSAWGPSIELAASSWGDRPPDRRRGHRPHEVGEIQGTASEGPPAPGRPGPLRRGPAALLSRPAAAGRPEDAAGAPDIQVAGDLRRTVDGVDGIVAFNDWYRVAKARDPIVHVVAAGATSSRSAPGARARRSRASSTAGRPEGTVHRRRRLPDVRAAAGDGEAARGERLHPREHGPRRSPISIASGRWGRPCRWPPPSRRPVRGPRQAPAPSPRRRTALERLHLYAENGVG